jgi:hypothetical protein
MRLRPETVDLRLDDIDRSRAAVAQTAETPQIAHADQRRHHRVEDSLRRLAAVGQAHRRRGHEMAHVAHEQQRAPWQGELCAILWRAPNAIGVQPARDTTTVLLESRLQPPRASGRASWHRRRPCPAHRLRRLQRAILDAPARDFAMTSAAGERNGFVEEGFDTIDDLSAA